MSLKTIDGTIDAVEGEPVGTSARATRFQSISIIGLDGVTVTLRNIRAEPAVAALIHAGTAGRFYLYNSLGVQGLHGVRPVVGAPAFGFPKRNGFIYLGVAIMNLFWIAWRTQTGAGIPLLGLALFMLGCIAYAVTNKTAMEARAQLANDTKPVRIPGQPGYAHTAPQPEAELPTN